MLTLVSFIIEVILLVNLVFLMTKLRKKELVEELKITISALALVGILMVATITLKMLSGY